MAYALKLVCNLPLNLQRKGMARMTYRRKKIHFIAWLVKLKRSYFAIFFKSTFRKYWLFLAQICIGNPASVTICLRNFFINTFYSHFNRYFRAPKPPPTLKLPTSRPYNNKEIKVRHGFYCKHWLKWVQKYYKQVTLHFKSSKAVRYRCMSTIGFNNWLLWTNALQECTHWHLCMMQSEQISQ